MECKLALFEEWGPFGNALILVASLLALYEDTDWTITNSVKVADITLSNNQF